MQGLNINKKIEPALSADSIVKEYKNCILVYSKLFEMMGKMFSM